MNKLTMQLPFYVTNKMADGSIGAFWFNAWILLLAQFLFFANAIVWGIIGLVVAFNVVF